MEHRQQMWALKRTHLFPDLGKASAGGLERKRDITIDELNQNPELRRLARAFHMHPEELVNKYDETRREVRHLHMDIYYRPMLPINAGLDDEQVELSTKATQERFESIGFADADAAMRHVTALTAGISRAAKSTASCSPQYCNGSAKGRIPDMGLLNWRKLEENFGPKADTSDSYAIHHPRHNAYATYYPTHDSSATHSTNPSNQSHGSATTTLCNHVHEKASTFKPRRRLNAMPATSTISPTPSEPCADTKSNASVSLG